MTDFHKRVELTGPNEEWPDRSMHMFDPNTNTIFEATKPSQRLDSTMFIYAHDGPRRPHAGELAVAAMLAETIPDRSANKDEQ